MENIINAFKVFKMRLRSDMFRSHVCGINVILKTSFSGLKIELNSRPDFFF